ncbi:MAG TPA: DUF2064 domain-containing protein [Solirubrobacteraceae bacterium]|nr:DUF2064 domain-containing protein [Solirubrobacteraceae bacterium]
MTVERAPEVLVVEPRPDRELEGLLGSRAASALRVQLYEQATALASRVGQGRVHRASPGTALSDAVRRIHGVLEPPAGPASPIGPLIVLWPELIRLDDRHVAGALEDLQTGADVVFGPVVDGGLYLLGLRGPLSNLLERLDEALAAKDPGALGLAAASELGLEIGLLRVERGLRTVADLEAAVADPSTPEALRRILSKSLPPQR